MPDQSVIPLGAVSRLVRWARDNTSDPKSDDILEVIDALWTSAGAGAYVIGAPHTRSQDCPTYYDGCHCNVDAIRALMDDNQFLQSLSKDLKTTIEQLINQEKEP